VAIRPVQVAARWAILLACMSLVFAVAVGQKKPPAKPINLNTATVEQLQQLPGIGPATAKAIVRFREKSGPFQRVEDLLAIKGISKRRLEQIRPHVFVEAAGPLKKPSS